MWNSANVKNAVLWVVVAVMAVVLLVGGDLVWSYWQGLQGVVRKELRDATSVQFELARLDQAIEALTPTLKENKKTVAELGVEIESLEADTVELERDQQLAKAEMQDLRTALAKRQGDVVLVDGKSFQRTAVEEDLSRRLRAYEQAETQLESRQALVVKRKEMLNKAINSIKQNEQEQQALVDLADTLNAELKLLEVATATSHFNFQPADLTKAQTLARDVQKKVETLQRLNDQAELSYEIPVNLDRRTATDRFDAKFASEVK